MNTALQNQPIGGVGGFWRFIQELNQRDAWLTRTGLFLLVLLIPCYLASLVDPRLFEGINVWIKPMKFQLSVGFYLLTVAWFMAYTRPEFQASRRRRWLSGILVAAALYEVLYITLQGGLAQASHFNESDALHGFLYSLMGFGEVMLTAMVGWQGVEVARHRSPHLPSVLQWSIAVGLMLTFILTTVVGFTISSLEGPIIGMARTETTGLWLFGWAREAGDLRVAHFVGTHAMHTIPLVAWCLSKTRIDRLGLWLAASVLLFVIVWLGAYLIALAGFPIIPLNR